MAFKGKHKIQDHWEKTIYYVDGQPCDGLLVFRITPVAGEGKVKIVIKACYSHLEAALRRILIIREVDKMLMDLRIASWLSLMIGFQRMKLGQQILNSRVRVMNLCTVCTSQV